MHIYYFTPSATPNFETEESITIAPQRHGSVGAHLAYAIATVNARRIQLLKTGKDLQEINETLNTLFQQIMRETVETGALLELHPLPSFFNFSSDKILTNLARVYILDSLTEVKQPSRQNLQEEKSSDEEEEHICSISLIPLRYGIRFKNDPNWYEPSNALCYLNSQATNNSPITRLRWSMEEIKTYNCLDCPENYDLNSTLNAIYLLLNNNARPARDLNPEHGLTLFNIRRPANSRPQFFHNQYNLEDFFGSGNIVGEYYVQAVLRGLITSGDILTSLGLTALRYFSTQKVFRHFHADSKSEGVADFLALVVTLGILYSSYESHNDTYNRRNPAPLLIEPEAEEDEIQPDDSYCTQVTEKLRKFGLFIGQKIIDPLLLAHGRAPKFR